MEVEGANIAIIGGGSGGLGGGGGDGGAVLHCGGAVAVACLLRQETEAGVLKAPHLSDLVSLDPPADQPLPVLDHGLVRLSPAPGTVSQPPPGPGCCCPGLHLN